MLRSEKSWTAASELFWRLAIEESRGFAQQTANFLPKKSSARRRPQFFTGVAYIFLYKFSPFCDIFYI